MASKSDFIYRYRIRNWARYCRDLVRRGSLTSRVDDQSVEAWRDDSRPGPLGGRPRTYSNTAIKCALPVKAVLHFSLRATPGLLESVVGLLGVSLPVPDYTTIRCTAQASGSSEEHGLGRGRRRT